MIVHVLRKPLVGTVASNALAHGAGALNIDQCRVTTSDTIEQSGEKVTLTRTVIAEGYDCPNRTMYRTDKPKERSGPAAPLGRWPANLVHDGNATTVKRFPDCMGGTWNRTDGARPFDNNGEVTNYVSSGSDRSFGSAARFFQQVVLPR